MTCAAQQPHPTASTSDFRLSSNGAARIIPPENVRFRHTINGRSALYRIFKGLPERTGDTILMPAFHCPTVVEPAVQAGFKISFYDVTRDLREMSAGDVSCAPENVAAVVVINYFGFDFSLASLRKRFPEALLIEDCSHSYYRADTGQLSGGRGIASVYSFWKLVPTQIGGAGCVYGDEVNLYESSSDVPCTEQLRIAKNLAGQLIGEFAEFAGLRSAARRLGVKSCGGCSEALLAGPIEQPAVEQAYPFSAASAGRRSPGWVTALVRHARIEKICAIRRRNYDCVAHHLADVPEIVSLQPTLESGVCPWAYPLLLPDRRNTDYRLRNEGVPLFTFGETLHALVDKSVRVPIARELSANLICLPVHQRLTEQHVRAFCVKIRRYFGLRE